MHTEHFDQAAATWDENPMRVALSAAIAAGIRKHLPLHPDMTVLEYGCGTAALSFLLSPHVGPILAMDASAGMVAQAARKITAAAAETITVQCLDLTADPLPSARFDLIVCAMALHHIEDICVVLNAFAQLLRPGGHVALADLCPEEGSFHGDMPVPHLGFDPAELAAQLIDAGLSAPAWRVIHEVDKAGKTYSVFLLDACGPKPAPTA